MPEDTFYQIRAHLYFELVLAGNSIVGNNHEMSQSERNSQSKNQDGENQGLILRSYIVSQVSSYFPTGGLSVTRTKPKIRKHTRGAQNFKAKT